MKKKLITYSLFGTNDDYINGAILNARQALLIYPEWQTRFYIDDTVPTNCIDELKKCGAEVILKEKSIGLSGTFWRFEPLFEADVTMISRDVDSKLTLRERDAVREWLHSDKTFHIMRDHNKHTSKILAGMFGSKPNYKFKKRINIYNSFLKTCSYGDDQYFLSRIIYPIIKNDVCIHSSGISYDSEQITSYNTNNDDNSFVAMNYKSNIVLDKNSLDPIVNFKTTRRERLQVKLYKIISLFNVNLKFIPSWMLLEHR